MSYGSDMLDKIKSNKSKSGNKVLLEQTEGAITGSAIGLFLGLYIAHSRQMSLIGGGLIGALAGGFIFKSLTSNEK
jgi:F0F1-type ATP synthase assembly protein I